MRRLVLCATLGLAFLVLWLVAGRGESRRGTESTGIEGRADESPAAPDAASAATKGSALPAGTSPPLAPRIRVRVVSPAGPLEGAEFRIAGEDAFGITGPDGVGEIGTDDVDVVWVRASKEGFLEVETGFPGGIDEGEIVLVPGVPIRGCVVRAEDGAPVAGAQVHAADRASGDELCRVLTTDDEGRFVVPGVPARTHVILAAMSPGFAPASLTGIAADGAAETRVVLGQGATVNGTVRGADGRAAGDVAIRLFPADDSHLMRSPDAVTMGRDRLRASARTTTDAEGGFGIAGVAPGEYVVLARGGAGAHARATLSIGSSGEAARVDLTLEHTGCILVRVVDPADQPVPQARLSVHDAAGKWILWPAVPYRTDARGEALATGLDHGAYDVAVDPDRWTAVRTRVLVERGPPAEVTLRVERGVPLEGTVRDPLGSPVVGVDVEFDAPADARNPSQHRAGITGRDGRFVLEGLLGPPGRLEVHDWAGRWASWRAEGLAPGGAPLSIVVRAAAAVSGRFEPVPRARRVAYSVASDGGSTGSWDLDLDPDGAFVLAGLDEGVPLTIHFDVPDGCPARCAVGALAPGERRDLGTVVVAPGRTLRARAVDQGGGPWAFTPVMLDYEEGDIQKYAMTDGDGRFTFENVDPTAAIWITVWNARTSGQTFEFDDWTKEPVHQLVVERPAAR